MRKAIYDDMKHEEEERQNNKRCENCNHFYFDGGKYLCGLYQKPVEDFDDTCDDWN
jgi:hypothetical protein